MLFDRQAKLAFIVVSLILIGCRIGFQIGVNVLNAYLEKKPVPLREQLSKIPMRLGDWVSSENEILTAEIIEELGTKYYINRKYIRTSQARGSNMLSVHITYYTGLIDAVPHVPDRCLVAGGMNIRTQAKNLPLSLDVSNWSLDREHTNIKSGEPYPIMLFLDRITDKPIRLRMPLGDFELRTTEFSSNDMPGARIYAGYFFIANGQLSASPEGVRLYAFDLTVPYAYYVKIQFLTIGQRSFESEDFVELVSDFLPELLPELMRCLPDWAEVELKAKEQSPEAST